MVNYKNFYSNFEYTRILVLGVLHVGKSTLINEITGRNDKNLHNHAKTLDDVQGDDMTMTTRDTSNFFVSIKDKNYIFVDSPGAFDIINDSMEKSCIHIENILRKVGFIDYIWICIAVDRRGIRQVDLKVIEAISRFPQFSNRIRIIVTKCDTIHQTELNNFVRQCMSNRLIKNYKFYTKNDPTYGALNYNSRTTDIFKNDDFDGTLDCNHIINHNIIYPILTQMKNVMIENNYFPIDYEKNVKKNTKKSNVVLGITIFASLIVVLIYSLIISNLIGVFLSLVFIIIFIFGLNNKYVKTIDVRCGIKNYRWNDESIIMKHVKDPISNHSLINTKIYYSSGELFYEGTLFGNEFDKGKYYYKNGDIMFED